MRKDIQNHPRKYKEKEKNLRDDKKKEPKANHIIIIKLIVKNFPVLVFFRRTAVKITNSILK